MYKVMIVDDEELVIQSLRAAVDWETLGFQIVSTANDGIEALGRILEDKPDLIFTDIRMPGLNGLELIQQIRKQYKRSEDMQFVLISGYAEFTYAQKAMKLSVAEYCVKPFDEDEIAGILGRIKVKLDHKKRNTEDLSDFGQDSTPAAAERTGRNSLMKEITEYIRQHYSRPDLSLDAIAKTYYVNPSYLSQMFRRDLQMTFTEYVTGLRLSHAMQLLQHTDLSIQEISESSGYPDYYYFTKLFKKKFQKKPSEFRV